MKKEKIFCSIAGFLAGIVSGFFGAGGGLILVPFVSSFLKEDEVKSRATVIMCIFFMTLTSGFFYFKENSIDLALSIKCALGGIIGGYIGSKLLVKINKGVLQFLFIIFLIYAGIKMIL